MGKSGCFVVFEGLDGSGKTTLIEKVAAAARSRLQSEATQYSGVVTLKEPTDLPSGKLIRATLSEKRTIPPEEWLEYFLKDRAENVKQNIGPLRAAGELILQDRYFYSTAAYQGKATGPLTPEAVLAKNLERNFPPPDLLFYIDISPEVALSRIENSRENVEYFETQKQLEEIRANYRKILPDAAIVLDGTLPPETLVEEALIAIFTPLRKLSL